MKWALLMKCAPVPLLRRGAWLRSFPQRLFWLQFLSLMSPLFLCVPQGMWLMICLPPRDTSPHQDSASTAPSGTPQPAQPPPLPQTRGAWRRNRAWCPSDASTSLTAFLLHYCLFPAPHCSFTLVPQGCMAPHQHHVGRRVNPTYIYTYICVYIYIYIYI